MAYSLAPQPADAAAAAAAAKDKGMARVQPPLDAPASGRQSASAAAMDANGAGPSNANGAGPSSGTARAVGVTPLDPKREARRQAQELRDAELAAALAAVRRQVAACVRYSVACHDIRFVVFIVPYTGTGPAKEACNASAKVACTVPACVLAFRSCLQAALELLHT